MSLAGCAGFWLFTVRPGHYLGNAAFLWKLGLIGLALGNVALQHADPGFRRVLAGAEPSRSVRLKAFASAVLWLAVLVAGRWIGFL